MVIRYCIRAAIGIAEQVVQTQRQFQLPKTRVQAIADSLLDRTQAVGKRAAVHAQLGGGRGDIAAAVEVSTQGSAQGLAARLAIIQAPQVETDQLAGERVGSRKANARSATSA